MERDIAAGGLVVGVPRGHERIRRVRGVLEVAPLERARRERREGEKVQPRRDVYDVVGEMVSFRVIRVVNRVERVRRRLQGEPRPGGDGLARQRPVGARAPAPKAHQESQKIFLNRREIRGVEPRAHDARRVVHVRDHLIDLREGLEGGAVQAVRLQGRAPHLFARRDEVQDSFEVVERFVERTGPAAEQTRNALRVVVVSRRVACAIVKLGGERAPNFVVEEVDPIFAVRRDDRPTLPLRRRFRVGLRRV